MNITYYGHACFLVEFGGKKLLFDPFISYNPLCNSSGVKAEDIEADYILLSHGHLDHLADAESIANRCGAPIIAVYEVQQWFEQKGLKGHGMNTGGQWNFDFGKVRLVNAIHSSVLPDGSNGGNPVGFVLSNDTEGAFYFAGDTALTMDMKLIPMICPSLNFCILPVGDNFTMGYNDAVIASDFVDCNRVIACHFDTFPPIEIDKEEVKNAFESANKTIFIPEIGQAFSF